MATYIYECSICGEFEATHSMKDVLEECPKCKEENRISPVKRLIAPSSFVLLGGGWAREGYK